MGLSTPSRTDPANAAPPAGKWKRRLLGALLALPLLAVLSPVLVARTPLRNWIVAKVTARFRGQIRVGAASLWWFTPPVFTDVEIRDADGRLLLGAPRIEGNKSLFALLRHPSDLGEFRVTRPVLHVLCSRDSTNLEDALAYWLGKKDGQPDSGPALEGIAVGAECTQARVVLEDADTGRTWALDPVDLAVSIPRDRRRPSRLRLGAAVAESAGRLSVELAARRIETPGGEPDFRAEGELHAAEVPLAAGEPFLRRLLPQLKIDGRLRADLALRPGDGPAQRLEGKVCVQALALSHPLLGADCLRLARVDVPCRLALNGGRLLVEQVEVQSDAGKASLAGTLDLARNLRDTLAQAGHRLDAQIDLARLAGLLPNTLHLTRDTQITSGTLSLTCRSSADSGAVRWAGELRTSDLQGTYQGQRITWKEPLAVVFAARQEANAWPVFERFRCDADFLRVEMSGSLDEFTARADFNLGRLGERLAGFVDLGPLRLQGEGQARLMAKRNARGGYRLESDVQIARLGLTDPAGPSFREDSLTVRLDVVGEAAGRGYRVEAGGLHVLAGEDGIDIDLIEPIADVTDCRAAGARVRVHGDLARWRGRLAGVTAALDAVKMAGKVELVGRLRYGPDAVRLDDLKVSGRAVYFEGLGVCANEPTLDFTTSGRWRPANETLELQQTRLSCPTVTVQAPAVTVATDRTGALQITAAATVQGDVGRLRRWMAAQTPPPLSPHGTGGDKGGGGVFAGRIDLRPYEGRQIVQLDLNVQDLTFGPPIAPIWREPRLHLTGHGVYDLLKDTFYIAHFYADSPTLTCDAAGQVAALHGDRELSLEGKLTCDLEKLEPRLRPYLGPLVRELSVLLKGPAALSLPRNSIVPFRIAGGRVYHRDLEWRFPELTIRTSGSVGLDGSLSLIADMPVPPKWLGSAKLAHAAAGQTIRLPIGGTLSRPKIDERALREASTRFAREAAENAIRQEMDGKLKNLLRRRK